MTPIQAAFVGGPLDGQNRIIPDEPPVYRVTAHAYLSRAAIDVGEPPTPLIGRYRRRSPSSPLGGRPGCDAVYDWDCWMIEDSVVNAMDGLGRVE